MAEKPPQGEPRLNTQMEDAFKKNGVVREPETPAEAPAISPEFAKHEEEVQAEVDKNSKEWEAAQKGKAEGAAEKTEGKPAVKAPKIERATPPAPERKIEDKWGGYPIAYRDLLLTLKQKYGKDIPANVQTEVAAINKLYTNEAGGKEKDVQKFTAYAEQIRSIAERERDSPIAAREPEAPAAVTEEEEGVPPAEGTPSENRKTFVATVQEFADTMRKKNGYVEPKETPHVEPEPPKDLKEEAWKEQSEKLAAIAKEREQTAKETGEKQPGLYEKMKSYASGRFAELTAEAGEGTKFERFFQGLGAKYNKAPLWQKIALGGSLALGYGLTFPISSWAAGAYAVPLVATRFAALGGSYLNNRKLLESIQKGEKKGVLASSRLYKWLASGSETAVKNKAMAKSILWSWGMAFGMGMAVKELIQHDVVHKLGGFISEHLFGHDEGRVIPEAQLLKEMRHDDDIKLWAKLHPDQNYPGDSIAESEIRLHMDELAKADPSFDRELHSAMGDQLIEGTAPASAPVHNVGVPEHAEAPAPPPAEAAPAPEMPTVHAAPGRGFEDMAYRLWQELQDKHLDPNSFPEGSDIRTLLETDKEHILGKVHLMALHNPDVMQDGLSATVSADAEMSVGADGNLHIEGMHMPEHVAGADYPSAEAEMPGARAQVEGGAPTIEGTVPPAQEAPYPEVLPDGKVLVGPEIPLPPDHGMPVPGMHPSPAEVSAAEMPPVEPAAHPEAVPAEASAQSAEIPSHEAAPSEAPTAPEVQAPPSPEVMYTIGPDHAPIDPKVPALYEAHDPDGKPYFAAYGGTDEERYKFATMCANDPSKCFKDPSQYHGELIRSFHTETTTSGSKVVVDEFGPSKGGIGGFFAGFLKGNPAPPSPDTFLRKVSP